MRNFDLQIPYRKVFFQHAVLSKFLGLTLLSTVSVLPALPGCLGCISEIIASSSLPQVLCRVVLPQKYLR